MRVVVPYAATNPKTRLDPLLDADERGAFSRVMLADVLAALLAAGTEPTVLSTDPLDVATDVAPDLGAEVPTLVDDRPLTEAVNAAFDRFGTPLAIVMADLPLLTARAVERLLEEPGDVVLAPGRGAGTNAVVSRLAAFTVDYHHGSFTKHRRLAEELGATLGVVDSHRLATDVDEPGDLVEVLVHATGRSPDWLRDHGVELVIERSRLAVGRPGA